LVQHLLALQRGFHARVSQGLFALTIVPILPGSPSWYTIATETFWEIL
jgi:hypothetical protein